VRSRAGGQALTETLLLGLVLLVPLIWMFGVLADVHRTALAATAAVREAGSDAARASDAASADRAVTEAVGRALVDHGVDPDRAEIRWSGTLTRGGLIEVEIGVPVSVVQAPLVGKVAGPSIWVRATHSARVDLYRSRE
jgi:hypothetical protein